MKKIIDFLKKFFSKNAGWKILSMIIAIALWIMVMSTLNPTETKTFTVSLTLSNEEALMNRGYAILNKEELLDTKVDIQVTGTRPAIDDLSKKSNTNTLLATVDLQEIEMDSSMVLPQNVSISLTPKISNAHLYSYELSSFSPTFVNVSVDAVEEKTLPITTNFVGQIADGYVAKEPEYNTSEVVVRGAATKLSQVEKVIANINIDGVNSDFSASIEPVVVNANAEEMSDFLLEPAMVKTDLTVYATKIIKINEPVSKGELDKDLILEGIDWSPKEIKLVGREEELGKIGNITLPEIDLSTLKGANAYTYELSDYVVENDDLYFAEATPKAIAVTVNVIGKDSKNISFSANSISVVGADSNVSVKIPNRNVITVFGRSEVLENINSASLKPILDVTGLGVGTHQVPLNITLPENVELPEDMAINVVISERVDTSVEITTEASVIEEEVSNESAEETVESTTEAVEQQEVGGSNN